jgi:dienelactone hydrolase
MRKLAGTLVIASLLLPLAAGAGRNATLAGTFTGTYVLPAGSAPVNVSLQLGGSRTLVVLGSGHAARTHVAARPGRDRLTLSLPGRPVALRFDLRLKGRSLTGSVRQGAVRGTASLRRGQPIEEGGLGAYRLAGGETLGVVSLFGAWFGIGYEHGEIHRLYRTGVGRYSIGAGSGVLAPAAGTARLTGDSVSWRGTAGSRLPLRQLEVRFGGAGAVLAGTLSLPAGRGPFPAVALVHGSGPTARDESSIYASFFASRGFAVLAYDKRGIGQSAGRYPGERASPAAVDTYARDAVAAVRFLASQPEVDRARLGLAGDSQAGWIMPLAASRETTVKFLVLFVGPTVTTGEQELWGSLTGQGQRDPGDLAPLEAQVRAAGPSGFDPMPSIRALRVPALWFFGGNDLNVPTRLCVERLDTLVGQSGRDFSYVVYPRSNHSLIESAHGLVSEQDRSSHYPAELFTGIEAWLAARGLRG